MAKTTPTACLGNNSRITAVSNFSPVLSGEGECGEWRCWCP